MAIFHLQLIIIEYAYHLNIEQSGEDIAFDFCVQFGQFIWLRAGLVFGQSVDANLRHWKDLIDITDKSDSVLLAGRLSGLGPIEMARNGIKAATCWGDWLELRAASLPAASA